MIPFDHSRRKEPEGIETYTYQSRHLTIMTNNLKNLGKIYLGIRHNEAAEGMAFPFWKENFLFEKFDGFMSRKCDLHVLKEVIAISFRFTGMNFLSNDFPCKKCFWARF